MFFDLELLCRQGKGSFIAPWLAATCGLNELPKKELDSANVVKLCNELQKLILSKSNKAKERASLSLSAKLVHGLALIHNKQASMLLDDTVKFLHDIEHPIFKKPIQRKPKAHVADVKDKSKRSKIKLSAEIVPENQHVFTAEEIAAALAEIPRASMDSITMREEVSATVSRDETGFGDLGGIEAELHVQKSGLYTRTKSPSRFQSIVEEVIEAQQITPLTELEIHDGEPAPKRPRMSLIEPPQSETPAKAVAVTLDEAQGPPTSLVVQPVTSPKKKRKVAPKVDEKYYIHEETATKAIRRREELDESGEINKATSASINADLIELRDIESSLLRKDVTVGGPDSTRISLRLSLMRSMRECRSSTPILVEQETTPVLTKQHPVPSAKIRSSSMHVILETSQEAPGHIMQPPPLASTPILEDRGIPPVDVEKTLEPIEEQAAFVPAEERVILSPIGSTQRRRETAKERQLAIIHIIQKWNFEEKDLTIEYLSGSPKTWQKFAAVLEDLLYMSKHKYVKLIRHSSSIELKCIEKAARLE